MKKRTLHITLTIITVLIYSNGFSQCANGACGPELIPNGDLTITTANCTDPNYNNILYYNSSPVQDWWGVYDYTVGGFLGTPDYYNPGCTTTGALTPGTGNNNAGNACPSNSGSIASFSNNFEYVQAQLLQPLVAGKQYCFNFDANDPFGNQGTVFFSPTKVLHTGAGLIPLPIAFTFSAPGAFFGCTSGTAEYCADGTEQWIILGPGVATDNFTIDNISLKEHCNSGLNVNLTATVNPVPCGGTTDITANITGNATGVTFVWTPNIGAGAGPHTVSPSGTTTYVVAASGNANCGAVTSYDTIVINASGITNTEAFTNEICAGANDGTITLNATSGAAPFTYDIGFGPTNATGVFTNLPPNTYNYIITDNTGCSITGSITILPGASCCPMTNTEAFTEPLCNGDCNGTITLTESGGTAPVTFSIDNGTTTQLNGNFTGLCAGVYQILIQDATGSSCQYTSTITLTDPLVISPTATSTDVLCNGACDGTLTGGGSGGTGVLTYSWDAGPTPGNQNQTNVCQGTYTITVTDANNCINTIPTTVNEPAALNITLNSTTDASCGQNNGGVDVSANGGTTTYTFDIGGTGQASGIFTGLAQGGYIATVTDNNGCTDTVSFNVANLTTLSGSVTAQTDASCNGVCDGTLTVTASGGNSPYTYDIGTGAQASGSFTGLCAGIGTVIITDNNNCVFNVPFTIIEPAAITGTINTQVDETCVGDCDGSVDVSGVTGTAPFTYDIGAGFQASGVFSNLCAGAGTITIEDANGCTGTINFTITAGLPAADATITSSNSFCENNASTNLTATDPGGAWTGNGITNATSGNFDPSIVGVGTTLITYTISGACGDVDTMTITVNAIPTVNAGLDVTLCEGNSITLSGQGTATSYSWDNGVTDNVPFTVGATTTYTVTGTDANGCSNTDDVTVTAMPQPDINFDIIPVTCTGEENGEITSVVTLGTPPYQLLWNNGDTTAQLTDLPIGTYTLTVTDTNGCTIVSTANVFSDDSDCEYVVWVANVFSPNGDGNNDVLHVMGENIESIDFIIYNRWGNKVFQSSDQKNGWDGTFNGKKLNTGVFAFYVKAYFIGGYSKELKGNVLLQK